MQKKLIFEKDLVKIKFNIKFFYFFILWVIKKNKNKNNRKYLNDALLTSIAGISAAMKNTG